MAQPELSRSSSLKPGAASRVGSRLTRRYLTPRDQALLYLLALGVAELLVALWEPRLGMILHGAILMALLFHATFFARGRWRMFFLALAMAPLIRLLSLTMPLPEFPFVYWYFIVGTPLLITAFMVMRYARLSRPMVGLTIQKPLLQILIGITGLALGWVEYLILRPDPLAEGLHWRYLWLPALILLVFTGFLEELIFRGVMQYTALRGFGRFGLWYVAAVFAVLHFGYRSFLDVVFVFAVAIYFAYAVQRTGSIFGVTLAHGLTNIALFLIFPFLLAQPVQQSPVPQDILAPPPVESATAIIIPTRTLTPTPTPSMTPTLAVPTATHTLTSAATLTETPSPPTGTPLPPVTECSPSAGWILYTVQFGDSWYLLSQRYGLSISELQQSNCLEAGAGLYVGQQIYVPYLIIVPTVPPTASATPVPTIRNTLAPSPTEPAVTSISVPPTAIVETATPALPEPTATRRPPTATRSPSTPLPPTPTVNPPADVSPTPASTFALPTNMPLPTPAPP